MSLEPTSMADIRYKCPVCFTALLPPVLQCENGHLLCGPCKSRLTNCPVCRVLFPEKRQVRNLAVEEIIRMQQHPCPNEDDGCGAILKFEQLEEHRLECKYTKFPICKKILNRDCEETSIADYEEHTTKVHGKNFVNIQNKSLPVSCNGNGRDVCDAGGFLRFRFMFEGKPTLAMLAIRLDNTRDHLVWRPYVLATRAVTNKLKGKIAISFGSTDKIVFESPIYNLQTETADLESCCTLSIKYWKALRDEEPGKCSIKVEISEKKKISSEKTT